MKESVAGTAGFCMGVILTMFVSVEGCSKKDDQIKTIQVEAIKRGHARWKVDDASGRTEFEWVEKVAVPPQKAEGK